MRPPHSHLGPSSLKGVMPTVTLLLSPVSPVFPPHWIWPVSMPTYCYFSPALKKNFFNPISSSRYYIIFFLCSLATRERGVCVLSVSQSTWAFALIVPPEMCSSGTSLWLNPVAGSPSLSLLACLQPLAQLLTPSSSASFALTWLPRPLALLAFFPHHWPSLSVSFADSYSFP